MDAAAVLGFLDHLDEPLLHKNSSDHHLDSFSDFLPSDDQERLDAKLHGKNLFRKAHLIRQATRTIKASKSREEEIEDASMG